MATLPAGAGTCPHNPAAFVWIKREDAPPAIVNRVFTALKEKGGSALPPPTATEIERLREEYSFFHWHLEFPDAFAHGGFSCGNDDHEEYEHPAVMSSAASPIEGYESKIHCVQHQLNGHEHGDHVALDDERQHSQPEKNRAQHQEIGNGNLVHESLFANTSAPISAIKIRIEVISNGNK